LGEVVMGAGEKVAAVKEVGMVVGMEVVETVAGAMVEVMEEEVKAVAKVEDLGGE
jgi:3-phosphoglycerate kinase